MKKFCLLLLALLVAKIAFADDSSIECSLTPEIWSLSIPAKFATTNNLIRKAGASVAQTAHGEKIILRGNVLDASCVPISDAVVEIWQPNYLGYFYYNDLNNIKTDPYFSDTGTFITDNMGAFHFVSIFPGKLKGRAPYISLRVRHDDFFDFETQIFFANQTSNKTDAMLNKYTTASNKFNVIAQLDDYYTDSATGDKFAIYVVTIVLDTNNKFKKY
jgi:protocatechuate 3,4-dioxygenase beta subunit